MPPTSPMLRSTITNVVITNPISTAHATAAAAGNPFQAICPTGARYTRLPKTTSIPTCFSPAPNSAFSTARMAVGTGISSRPTFRPSMLGILKYRDARAIWSSAHSAAASMCLTIIHPCVPQPQALPVPKPCCFLFGIPGSILKATFGAHRVPQRPIVVIISGMLKIRPSVPSLPTR